MGRLLLSNNDKAMLEGRFGKATQFAMEVIAMAANIEAAEDLIDITFAHIDSCFYSGRAHLDFVNFLLDNNATLAVPCWTNNGLISLNDLSIRDPGKSREMEEARQLMQSYVRLGCKPVWTCAPYQLPGRPTAGDHIVGSESNAVSFYNSVIGARTNKYGDFFDVCAALTGRVPNSGLHRSELRKAQIVFDVQSIPVSVRNSDNFYHLLGHYLGRHCGHQVPAITGLSDSTDEDDLKAISAAGSSSGSVPLFHAVGITPEADTLDHACQNEPVGQVIEVQLEDLNNARYELSQCQFGKLTGVALGTPHFSCSKWSDWPDHDQCGQVGLLCTRYVIAETIRNGTGPQGFMLAAADTNICVGVSVANRLYDMAIPVIEIDSRYLLQFENVNRVSINRRGVIHFES